MGSQTDSEENRKKIRSELKRRFDPDTTTLAAVMDKIEEAQQPENLPDYSHWNDPENWGMTSRASHEGMDYRQDGTRGSEFESRTPHI